VCNSLFTIFADNDLLTTALYFYKKYGQYSQENRFYYDDIHLDDPGFFLRFKQRSLPSLQAAEAEQMRLFPLVLSFTSKQDHFLCR